MPAATVTLPMATSIAEASAMTRMPPDADLALAGPRESSAGDCGEEDHPTGDNGRGAQVGLSELLVEKNLLRPKAIAAMLAIISEPRKRAPSPRQSRTRRRLAWGIHGGADELLGVSVSQG